MPARPPRDDAPAEQRLPLALPPCPLLRCGLDEVGRGALAGPLVAAAVVLPDDIVTRLGPLARFLRDSKTVPRARRVALAAAIRRHALALEVAEIAVSEINLHGIGWANREAFYHLIAAIHADEYVVDGRVRPPAPAERAARVRCLVRADSLVPAVSAASLVAKAHRDALMAGLHTRYTVFGWNTNAGYGTAHHLAALRAHGPSPEHRVVFVATALSGGQRARRTVSAQSLPLLP
ncbi:MAG: ribonuclease HII [Ktedonobacterales bacterium]|nr:ribonuclease HII [Ktedonobacterales bacterium]